MCQQRLIQTKPRASQGHFGWANCMLQHCHDVQEQHLAFWISLLLSSPTMRKRSPLQVEVWLRVKGLACRSHWDVCMQPWHVA